MTKPFPHPSWQSKNEAMKQLLATPVPRNQWPLHFEQLTNRKAKLRDEEPLQPTASEISRALAFMEQGIDGAKE